MEAVLPREEGMQPLRKGEVTGLHAAAAKSAEEATAHHKEADMRPHKEAVTGARQEAAASTAMAVELHPKEGATAHPKEATRPKEGHRWEGALPFRALPPVPLRQGNRPEVSIPSLHRMHPSLASTRAISLPF